MKKLSIDAFTLKIIAITSMALHHTVMILWELFPMWLHLTLYVMRGVTFPIMAFFLTEGFRRSSNIKRYMLRLLIFALIAQVPYTLAFGAFQLNIIFTILLGLISLRLYDKWYVNEKKQTRFVLVFLALLLVSFVAEGAAFGVLLIFLFHVIKDEKKRRTIPLIFWGGIMIIGNLIMQATVMLGDMMDKPMFAGMGGFIELEMLMSSYYVFSLGVFGVIPLLRAYNGQRGRRAKFLFYTFYPLHFAILAAIAYALGVTDFSIITNLFSR